MFPLNVNPLILKPTHQTFDFNSERVVTGGAIFCVYDAASEDLVHEHSKRSGIGITEVSEISSVVRHNTSLVS